jgi:uncharacterized protein YutD
VSGSEFGFSERKSVEKQYLLNFCQITMSYFVIIDARMSVSEKEEPVPLTA